jgi:hypothetical protein
VAHLGGAAVRPDLSVGRNAVHAVLRSFQWNSPVVVVCGWHLHRHHRGLQFLIDTTNKSDFYLATSGDLYLATSQDFFMAMVRRRSHISSELLAEEVSVT